LNLTFRLKAKFGKGGEFLIDSRGYVRALWLPRETAAWDDVRSLVPLVGQFAKRPLAPYSSGHAH
jgi:hypothetical protein